MKKSIYVIVAVVLLILLSIKIDNKPYNSSNNETIELRMSQTSSSSGAIGQTMEKFAEEINKKTNGRYKINTFHNGQLGGERDNIEGCQLNTIDIVIVNQATLANFVPEIGALDIPYLFTSYEHADNVFLGEVGNELLDSLNQSGIYGLGIWESGFRNLTNSKKEVNSLEDVNGLKIRTMENKVHLDFWRQLNTDPVPMAWSEAYTAMQQGAIDGQENPSAVISTNNVVEVNKNMAITEHAYSTVFILMSSKAYNSLSEEDRAIFMEVINEMNIYERELNREMETASIKNLEERGMVVTYPNKDEFIEASEDFRLSYEDEYSDIINKIKDAQPVE